MATLRDRLPVVARGHYEAALRERDGWELRARLAAQRAADARQAIVPAAPPRRSRLAIAIAGLWLVVIGVFVGGAAIPHHDDEPRLASGTDAVRASAKTSARVAASCADLGETTMRVAGALIALPSTCPRSARATPGGSQTPPPRQPPPG
jgi:hypothetical protein